MSAGEVAREKSRATFCARRGRRTLQDVPTAPTRRGWKLFSRSWMRKKKRVVLVLSLIMERPMCLLCVAGKTGRRNSPSSGPWRTRPFSSTPSLTRDAAFCGSTLGPVFSLTQRSAVAVEVTVEVSEARVDEMAEIAEAITGASVCSFCAARGTGLALLEAQQVAVPFSQRLCQPGADGQNRPELAHRCEEKSDHPQHLSESDPAAVGMSGFRSCPTRSAARSATNRWADWGSARREPPPPSTPRDW